MDADELESLRRRVEAKKRAQEAAALAQELRPHSGRPIDRSVVYLTWQDVGKQARRGRTQILADIAAGLLPADFAIVNGRRRFVIHPDDAKAYIQKHAPVITA